MSNGVQNPKVLYTYTTYYYSYRTYLYIYIEYAARRESIVMVVSWRMYNGSRQVFSDTHSAYTRFTRLGRRSKSRCRQSIVIGHEFLLLSLLYWTLVIVFVSYRYYNIIIMIDYKNVIFYIAERYGVLLCIIIISVIIVYPSGDNVITRAHSRRAFGSRDAERWVLGIPRPRSRTSIKRGTVDRRKTNIITDRGAFWKSNINLDWLFTAVCG